MKKSRKKQRKMKVNVEEFCKGLTIWYKTESRYFVRARIKEEIKKLYLEMENAR